MWVWVCEEGGGGGGGGQGQRQRHSYCLTVLVLCKILGPPHHKFTMAIYKVIFMEVHVAMIIGDNQYTSNDTGHMLSTIYGHYYEGIKVPELYAIENEQINNTVITHNFFQLSP